MESEVDSISVRPIINNPYTTQINNLNPLVSNKGKYKSPAFLHMKDPIPEIKITNVMNVKISMIKPEGDLNGEYHHQNSKISNNSENAECSMGHISAEREIPNYVFGIPEFEVKNTMNKIKQRLKKKRPDSHRKLNCLEEPKNQIQSEMLARSVTKLGPSSNKDDQIFIKPREQSKNYFQYVLTMKAIYAQYIKVANCNQDITRSLSFKAQAEKNESFKHLFPKDMEKCKS